MVLDLAPKISTGEYKVINIGESTGDHVRGYPCRLLSTNLKHIGEMKDLGVNVYCDLKFETHFADKVKKANSMARDHLRFYQRI